MKSPKPPPQKEIRATQLSVRLEPSVKAALSQAAEQDSRSLASFVELILKDWIKNKEIRK